MKTITECIPIIPVNDLTRAQGFYAETLGFSVDFDFEDVVGLLHGSVLIYLISAASPNCRQPAGSANLNFLVDEVDELFDRCKEADTTILVEPEDRPYGQRDFAVKDPDGNVLFFACGLEEQSGR
jgi:catechol 2,3-dioxygenase-like lactoylglutathione lyase family enzyme